MNNKGIVFLIMFNFALGIYAGLFFEDFYAAPSVEKTEQTTTQVEQDTLVLSPRDRIKEENIAVYSDSIVIDLKDLKGREISWATYTDTKSMVPTLGKGCNGLEFVPDSPEEISIGDMIAFKRSGSLIIHRVVETGTDELGWYAVTKGDNNEFKDERISFAAIEFVTFGIIC